MAIYAIFAAIVLIGSLLPFDLIPPLLKGRANNNPLRIRMPDRRNFYRGYWPCVYAQEIAEWWVVWFVAIVLGLPFAVLLTFADFAVASPLVAFLLTNWRSTVWGARQLEYIGHAVEREVGVRLDIERYRNLDAFARIMHDGYRRLFSGAWVTVGMAKAGLQRWEGVATFLLVFLGPRVNSKV